MPSLCALVVDLERDTLWLGMYTSCRAQTRSQHIPDVEHAQFMCYFLSLMHGSGQGFTSSRGTKDGVVGGYVLGLPAPPAAPPAGPAAAPAKRLTPHLWEYPHL